MFKELITDNMVEFYLNCVSGHPELLNIARSLLQTARRSSLFGEVLIRCVMRELT